MNNQNSAVMELNAVLEKLVQHWICIINVDVEFCFTYDDDNPNPYTSTINGYQADAYHLDDFGSCCVDDEGPITVTSWPNLGGRTASISTSIRVNFPDPLMQIFKYHVSQELFEHPFEYIAFDCKIDLPAVESYSLMMYLHGSIRDIRLDAYSETVLRPNASALIAALEPYAFWFKYAAYLADRFEDENERALLIKHLRAICTYLERSDDQSFAKMTSLCSIAGSLQPAVSLIQKKMPELVV
jgi:hypothetical protein